MVAGRNDDAIAEALRMLAGSIGQIPQVNASHREEVDEYAARFQELIKYCPHYNTVNAERSKCLKFVNGLRPDIKKAIGYQ